MPERIAILTSIRKKPLLLLLLRVVSILIGTAALACETSALRREALVFAGSWYSRLRQRAL